MYDLSLHVRYRLLAAACTIAVSSVIIRNEQGARLAVEIGSAGNAEDLLVANAQPSARSKDWVRSTSQFFLHMSDGLTFSERIATGTQFGDIVCDGLSYCQFKTFDEARDFCNADTSCDGILQQTNGTSSGCEGGYGCFFPAKGHLQTDISWRREQGKTYERQVLAYNNFNDGRKLSNLFPVGTRQCLGVHNCQFLALKPALDFCDLDSTCLGVLRMPASVNSTGNNCQGGKGCYSPGKGSIFHDPLWLQNLGETFLKEQEVAYALREPDGMIFTGRFATGTAGCKGVHTCQFKSLEDAQAYCDADPSCKGVMHRPVKNPQHNQECSGGLGCFEPCKGQLSYNAMFLVTEGKVYERRLVR